MKPILRTRIRLQALAIFSLLVLLPLSQTHSQCASRKDQKFTGTKIIDLYAPSVEFCCLECSNYAACVAWNYEGDANGQCELFSSVTGDSLFSENSNTIYDLLKSYI